LICILSRKDISHTGVPNRSSFRKPAHLQESIRSKKSADERDCRKITITMANN
jgi:hypothetical protein